MDSINNNEFARLVDSYAACRRACNPGSEFSMRNSERTWRELVEYVDLKMIELGCQARIASLEELHSSWEQERARADKAEAEVLALQEKVRELEERNLYGR